MFKLFRYLKKYWWAALLAPLFMVGEVSFDMVVAQKMQILIDDGIQASNIEVVKSTGLIMLGYVFAALVCGVLSGVFANIASSKYANDLRKSLFDKIMHLSFDQTDDFNTASLITRVGNDVTQMQNFIGQMIRMFVRSFGMFILGIVFTLGIDKRFAIVLAVALPIEVIVMLIFMKLAFPSFSVIQKKLDKLNKVVHENVSGARVVKAFSKEDYEMDRFDVANTSMNQTMLYVNKLFALLMPLFMLIVYAAQIAIYSIGGSNILDAFTNSSAPTLSIGKITQAGTYIVMIVFSLIQFGMMFSNIARANASAKRINEVLDCKLEIADGNVTKEEADNGVKGTIEFKNVSFQYPGANGNVLENLSFTINKGETVSIVGATGCGKTTLINLITRFYDVTDGEVLVDNINVKDYKQYDLREKISVALQKAELFAGSIKENIMWGKKDATEDEVIQASQIAQAEEFVLSKEDKYDEYIEEKGTSLSGGQKQRLSIARAIIKKPEILIFDDATSALDLVTEANLYKELNTKMKDTTKVVVAQRIATAKNADRIIVLDQGAIVAFDTHENLLKNCEIYMDIYNSQLKKDGENNG